MKNIIFLLLLVSNLSFAKVGVLDAYWLGEESIAKSADGANLDSIDNFLTNVAESDLDALNSVTFPVDKSTDKPWYFAGMQTGLGLGLSGEIGIVTFGGTKTILINWDRKKPEPKTNEEDSAPINTVVVNEGTSKADVEKEIEPIIRSLVDSKKVENEAELRKNLRESTSNFLSYAKGMEASQTRYKWRPTKIRLDFNFEASGKIVTPGPLVKAGADMRIRLEFIRIMPESTIKSLDDKDYTRDLNEAELRIAKSTKSFVEKLSEEVTRAYEAEVKENDMEKRGLVLKYLEVGLGIEVSGKVGVASLKGSVVPSLWFSKVEDSRALPARDKSADDKGILIFNDANPSTDKSISDTLFELEGRRIQKGMRKAAQFAFKTAEKLQKNAQKNPKSNWRFKSMESRYNFSVGGSVGVVKLHALPHFIMHIENTK